MPSKEAIAAGQSVYSKAVLVIYDIWVLGVSNSFIWQCPTKHLRKIFRDNVTINHLDVGVGTGYYLAHCLTHTERRLALLDLNPNCIEVSAAKVSRFHPECYQANILEPLKLDMEKFDSISINFLLHCLPGNMAEKAVLFEYLSPYLNAGGVIFGSTILGQSVPASRVAKKLMDIYVKKGIFDNHNDSLETLQEALCQHFDDVQVEVQGCVAVFKARQRT